MLDSRIEMLDIVKTKLSVPCQPFDKENLAKQETHWNHPFPQEVELAEGKMKKIIGASSIGIVSPSELL